MDDLPNNVVPITSQASHELASFGSTHGIELLTILFTDLVDSTKLQGELGNVESARLTELHRKLVCDLLAEYDAKEIEWAGDSCLAVFTKPSDGVVFALRLQASIREAQQTEPKLPAVRIGLHLGEIFVRHRDAGGKDNLFGLQVSEAARIMSLARAGQVYCSRAVLDNARSSLTGRAIPGINSIAYVNHGPFILKGVPDPVEICEVLDADLVRPKAPEANEKCRPAGVAARIKSSPMLATGMAIAMTLVIAAMALVTLRPGSREGPADSNSNEFSAVDTPKVVMRRLALPSDLPLAPPEIIVARSLDISPDGQLIAYASATRDGDFTVVLPRDSIEGTVVEGSLGTNRQVFSPDGKWLAASRYATGNQPPKLIKYPVSGGAPVFIADMRPNFFVAWTEDGENLLYTPDYGHGLYMVSASGGTPVELTTLESGSQGHAIPTALPGGKGIVYNSFTVPSASATTTMVLDLTAKESKPVMREAGCLGYLSNGYLILTQVGRLMALPFDASTLEATGPAFDVTPTRMTTPDVAPSRLAFSKSGTLVYVPIDLDETDALMPVWVTPDGRETELDLPPDRYFGGAVSPDGRYLALNISTGAYANFWLHDLERGTTQKLTYGDVGKSMLYPVVWSHDSRSFFYAGAESGSWGIQQVATDSSEDPKLIYRVPQGSIHPISLTPDGAWLLSLLSAPPSDSLLLISLDGSAEPDKILDGPGHAADAEVSPDGKWITYASDESGQWEIYVQRYPEGGSKQQVSKDGGRRPTWSADGGTLYFKSRRGEFETVIHAVDVGSQPQMTIGIPRIVRAGLYFNGSFDKAGNRFIEFKSLSRDTLRVGGTELIVVEHWDEEVRQREPKER